MLLPVEDVHTFHLPFPFASPDSFASFHFTAHLLFDLGYFLIVLLLNNCTVSFTEFYGELRQRDLPFVTLLCFPTIPPISSVPMLIPLRKIY